MSCQESIKNLVTRTRTDPWGALVGRRPESYQIPEVGNVLIEMVDQALVERQLDKASDYVSILKRWSRHNPTFKPKALAAEGAFFMVCRKLALAEEKMTEGKMLAGDQTSPLAECYRRLGALYLYQYRFAQAIDACNTSIRYFRNEGNTLGIAISLMTRGYARWQMKEHASGLHDEERGIELLDYTMPFFHLVTGSVNAACILTDMGRPRTALAKIEDIQSMIRGQPNMERPRLSLRWLRALLLEQDKKCKEACELLDRVDRRFVKLDMDNERRVLLADYARISKSPKKIRNLAERGKDLEMSPDTLEKIDQVLQNPSEENIRKWRESLDSYMPIFPKAA